MAEPTPLDGTLCGRRAATTPGASLEASSADEAYRRRSGRRRGRSHWS